MKIEYKDVERKDNYGTWSCPFIRAGKVKETVKKILAQLTDIDKYSDASYIVEKEMGWKLI